MKVLSLRGFISAINPDDRNILYYITPSGIEVIKEIENNYNSVLYSFCDQYGIIL